MTNEQFDEVQAKAKAKSINLNICPTCESPLTVVADPIEGLPGAVQQIDRREYRFLGKTYRCDCHQQDELRRRYLLANIPVKYWRYSADDWYGDDGAWEKANHYLDLWPRYKKMGVGIEFFSPTQGTGKTFLATWIARQLVQKGESVYYSRFLSLMDVWEHPDRYKLEHYLRSSTALVLDEVGYGATEAQTGYFARQFEDLMRSRVDNALPTIMTTNMIPSELDRYYPRTYSVIQGAQIRYEVPHEDVRRRGDTLLFDEHLVEQGEIRPIC